MPPFRPYKIEPRISYWKGPIRARHTFEKKKSTSAGGGGKERKGQSGSLTKENKRKEPLVFLLGRCKKDKREDSENPRIGAEQSNTRIGRLPIKKRRRVQSPKKICAQPFTTSRGTDGAHPFQETGMKKKTRRGRQGKKGTLKLSRRIRKKKKKNPYRPTERFTKKPGQANREVQNSGGGG